MPPNFFTTATSRNFPDAAVTETKKFDQTILECKGGEGWRHFYPLGKPISLHRLHRGPFAVYKYSFMGHFFAATAILTCK
jgi:hypothetical protein